LTKSVEHQSADRVESSDQSNPVEHQPADRVWTFVRNPTLRPGYANRKRFENIWNILFRIFLRKEIIINSLKIFLDYQNVILLKQRMNAFELIIVEKKLKTIAFLKFSENLIALERYLDLADYLRDKVYFFVDVFKSFQELKIKLLKNFSKDNRRKKFINKTKIIFIDKKMTFFLLLQKDLIKTIFLMHFDKSKWLWIDLDEFKEFDFEVIVFHVIKKFSKETWSIKNDI
jgi:hypothetical protein